MLRLMNIRSVLERALLWCDRKTRKKINQAKLDISRRAKLDSKHHWIFDHFNAFRGEVPTNFHVTYIGDRVRDDFVDWQGRRTELLATPDLPPFDYEYFEWIDILEAVKDAGSIFTMLEVGAGYGRWTSRAALAAFQLGKKPRLGLIEADPKHVIWLQQCMADNGVSADSYKVYPNAIGACRKECIFKIELPASSTEKNWFGQAIATEANAQFYPVEELYYGVPKMRRHDGGYIKVRQITLTDVLDEFTSVDIIHMDIQGAEADAIEESITLCTQKVRRLNIGTHDHDIEARLRLILNNARWICLRDYPCEQINQTDFGPMSFVDGLQTWINPKLMWIASDKSLVN
jgi:FkbM family methyltransferase